MKTDIFEDVKGALRECLNEQVISVEEIKLIQEAKGVEDWWDKLPGKLRKKITDILGLGSNSSRKLFSKLDSDEQSEIEAYFSKHKGKVESIGLGEEKINKEQGLLIGRLQQLRKAVFAIDSTMGAEFTKNSARGWKDSQWKGAAGALWALGRETEDKEDKHGKWVNKEAKELAKLYAKEANKGKQENMDDLDEANAIEYKVELANKIIKGRSVGNLYGVSKFVNGKRHGWMLEPQDNEEKARRFAKKMNAAFKNEDVELDEIVNVFGTDTHGDSNSEAAKFAIKIKKTIQKHMPPGYVLKCDFAKDRFKPENGHIYIVTTLEEKDKWTNGIIENDRALQKFFILGMTSDGKLKDSLSAELIQGGSLLVKTEPGSHYAFGKVKFGWRNKKGTPAQIEKHFDSYFAKVAKVIKDNKANIPESIESVKDLRNTLLGEAKDTNDFSGKSAMDAARDRVMAKFTDPKAAKAALAKDAQRHTPLQFRRFLVSELDRAKRGKTASGAFPHKPNPKIIFMITKLKAKYDAAYNKFEKQGMASDEKNDAMMAMHNKVISGKLIEAIQCDIEGKEGDSIYNSLRERILNKMIE